MEQTNTIDCKKALSYLKSGYALKSIISRNEIYFKLHKDEVNVFSETTHLKINIYSFLDIYKDCKFEILTESDEEAVDPLKDKEYYSWKQ